MAYTIAFTDEINKGTITVEDNTINQELSIGLVGRNATAFGQIVAENALHMLENFAFDTPPDTPAEGQLWYDTTVGNEQLKVYDGTNWIASGGLKKANTAPDVSSSVAGDLWADTDNQQLYLFTGSGWLLVGPQFSEGLTTGVEPVTIVDTANIDHTVIDIKVRANTVAIISTDEFTPKSTILGFSTIKPGINLSAANFTGAGISKYFGTSEKAENLIVGNEVVSSTSFLRNDIVSTTDFALRIKNNAGLIIGNSLPLSIGIEGESAVISHNTTGSSIDLRVNNNGQVKTPIRINSDTNVGINNTNPTESLDVVGNIKADSALFINGVTESTNFGSGSIIVKGGLGVAKNLNVGGALAITGSSTFANVIPDTAITTLLRNLGSSAARWDSVYANNFRGNLVGNVTGTVSGRSGSADKLTSSTQFRLTGDVSAPEFAFDGTAGGNIKTFTTSISNAFISNKPAVASTLVDDEVLINRTSGTPGLFRVSRANFLSSIPTTPIGLISPYGGTIAPLGYFLCDGSEKDKAVFAALFAIIGFSFRDPTQINDGGVSFFAVPDFRGRFPLGLDDMGTDEGAANRVTSAAADGIGNTDGSESKDVKNDNLPEHEHDLRTPNGDQFYATRDILIGNTSDPSAIPYDAPTGSLAGSATSTSGGLVNGGQNGTGDYRTVDGELLGNKLDVMNPYQAVNYIIYHGVFT
jgi:microcystin-dependent protein|tara:strand:- start:11411 stop:13501 length:2091 start_codon:yes stop_codon:yes gene_type:complete